MRAACLIVVVLAAAICPSAHAHPGAVAGSELVERLPHDVSAALSFENARTLRQSMAGQSIAQWMDEQNAISRTRHAWDLFAARLGVTGEEAFDSLLGGNTVIALGHRNDTDAGHWIVLAAIDSAMDVRLLQRTRAVPRKIAFGRPVLGLEEESFLLATLPPLSDGRSVVALAPAGAEWLLLRTLGVAAGKYDALDGAVLGGIPAQAVVRGFWKPAGAPGILGDTERWFWDHDDPMHALSIWATVRGTTVEVSFCPLADGWPPVPQPTGPLEGVLLDVSGPGSAIVTNVLDRAGLSALVPEDLRVTRLPGELVVRRGSGGVELGARLPVITQIRPGEDDGLPVGEQGEMRIRELAETPASRAIFGSQAKMAWTLLSAEPGPAELLVAVASEPEPVALEAVGNGASEPVAAHIVGQAIDRPG
ncbi:MAG: hypothetical protein ACIAS6_12495, partial [Phycisphaerales bacterium JB060]